MDHDAFDALSRRVAQAPGRRLFLRGALVGLALPASLAAGPQASVGRSKRKRKKKKRARPCKAPNVPCGQTCLPPGSCCVAADCGECQQCAAGACVARPDATACGVGGCCEAGACVALGSFGCTPDQDQCQSNLDVPCPLSVTEGARCFVRAAGVAICATQRCRPAFGSCSADEITLRCPACGATDACIRPVTA
ncbi:MAG: hypothetical protein KC442_22950 [Thermomicrobiales bacterium]|nr:hypothetical protein [Thermomicrobiales bacterium]